MQVPISPRERPPGGKAGNILSYAAVGQIGGGFIGPALGYAPFSFHLAGTLVGCATPPHVGEFWTWAIYNFVVFAVAP